MDENKGKIVILSSLFNYTGHVFYCFFSFLTLVYLIRVLTVESFGLYNILVSTVIFLAIIINFGFPSAISRYIPEYIAKGIHAKAKKRVIQGMAYSLAGGAIAGVILSATSGYLARLLDQPDLPLFLPLLAILATLRIEAQILESVLDSLYLQGYKNLANSLIAVLRLILFVLAMLYGYGVLGLVISLGMSDLMLCLLYLKRLYPSIFKADPTMRDDAEHEAHRLFQFRLKEYFNLLISSLRDFRVDVYLITIFLGLFDAGLFSIAANIANFLFISSPSNMALSAVKPMFVEVYLKPGGALKLNDLFQQYNSLIIFFTVPMFIGFGLLFDKIVEFLLAPQYLPSLQTLWVLLGFMIFKCLTNPVRSVLIALEKMEIVLYSNGVTITYKLLMSILLIPIFGILGAALAYGSSIMIEFFVLLFLTRRYIHLHYTWIPIQKVIVNSLVMAVIVFFLKSWVSSLTMLFGLIFLGALAYFVASYFNSSLTENERGLFTRGFKVPV
jgi:O-antigen/teichoic acid export membrane protein